MPDVALEDFSLTFSFKSAALSTRECFNVLALLPKNLPALGNATLPTSKPTFAANAAGPRANVKANVAGDIFLNLPHRVFINLCLLLVGIPDLCT